LIKEIQNSVYKNGYLLIAAAWLYTISFIASNYWSYSSSPTKVKQSLETFLADKATEAAVLANDSALLYQLSDDKIHAEAYDQLSEEAAYYFLYRLNDLGNPILDFWNTNVVLPAAEDVLKSDGNYFVNYQNGQFNFIKKTIQYRGRTLLWIAMIPIRWDYFIENKYLHKAFAAFPGLENRYDITSDSTAIAIKNANGKSLFYIQEIALQNGSQLSQVSILLRVLAIIAVLIVINAVAVDLVHKINFRTAFLFLISVLFAIRISTYFLPIPFDFRMLELFDPSVFASDAIHPSLGDLLLNIIVLFWLSSFCKSFLKIKDLQQSSRRKYIDYTLSFAIVALYMLLTFAMYHIIKSLVNDSKISFDVTNFYSLNIYTVVCFGILSLAVLSYHYIAGIFFQILVKRFAINKLYLLALLLLTGLLALPIFNHDILVSAVIVNWMICYGALLIFFDHDNKGKALKSGNLLWWLVFFSVSVAVLITYQNNVIETEQRKKIAEKLSLQTDPSGESLIGIALTNFSNNFLNENFSRFQFESSNKFLKDSLINQNFSGYLNKYDTRIYTYDSAQQSLFNDDSTAFADLNTIIKIQSKPTTIPDLYYYENSFDKFSYLYQQTIKNTNEDTIGFLIVVAKPKKYKSEALYPELFKQVKDVVSDLNTNYVYAVYSNNKLINSYGDNNFPIQLNADILPKQEFESRLKNDYHELWYSLGSGKVVIIAKTESPVLGVVTLFAYLFCAFLLVLLVFAFFNILLTLRFRITKLKQVFTFSIRTQIQATIIAVSVFSFVVIGFATISFFIARFERGNKERLVKAIEVMRTEIENKIRSQFIFDDGLSIADIGLNDELEKKIIEVSEIHNVDVNFYDLNGTLKVSTQPYIYNKHVLSEKMDPVAFHDLHHVRSSQFMQVEHVGNFKYLSIYVPIRDESGNPYAFINIPYLNSQNELNLEISGFLVTLINLIAFIFLIAGAIAVSLTNKITASFLFIGNKMKEINLGKHIEEIDWKGNDEIGALVIEYNKMVRKLEESAKALAQSEREGAWREMAKQVAHEIKNPLTPMKLSIQYLQKAIAEDQPTVKTMSQRVANTLIEQIDQLSKIAADFSQFANIGSMQQERFALQEVIQTVIDLHSLEERVSIEWNKLAEPIVINADKVQMNRMFTNIIQNAIQSVPEESQVQIGITEQLLNNHCMIAISDNGVGIPAALQPKIFTPNFTTKTSGTGLGLAICKGILENIGGRIWFESSESGTTFYIEIPLNV